ncbi:MAG TPA: hypothetical protein P5248_10835, partial [Bacteroidales bacterium]|nr:hypothetical protein [Bacteroidales bacterium]
MRTCEHQPSLLLLLLLLAHLPFLAWDPDGTADVHTRGAWTDEGLYASQTLNFIETGRLDLHENSTLVRGPLFNVVQYPFFLIAGPHREVARLLVLLSVLGSLWFLLRVSGLRLPITFLVLITFTQYQVFHFSHYAMAEMMCVASLLMSLGFFVHTGRDDVPRLRALFWSAFFLFVAYGLKVQYLYAAAVLPMASLLLWAAGRARGQANNKNNLRAVGWSAAFTFTFLLLYLLAWYLPHREFYHYIMGSETQGRYPAGPGALWETFRFNFEVGIWSGYTWGTLLLFAISALALPLLSLRKKGRIQPALAFALAWILLEVHKLPMTYLPNRYLLSLYVALGLLSALLLARVYRQGLWGARLTVLIAAVMLVMHGANIERSLAARTNDLGKVNAY